MGIALCTLQGSEAGSLVPISNAIAIAIFLSPPEGGLDLVTNRKGAI